jgi:DNA-binding XRE family transcriptional regulator
MVSEINNFRYHICVEMARTPQAEIDNEFWDRVRESLKAFLRETDATQKELAGKLGIEPGTLNNFLKGHSQTLGGRAVALACTFIDLLCSGVRIGRLPQKTGPGQLDETLVLKFDSAFRVKMDSRSPTLVLKRPPSRAQSVRLAIRRLR